MMGRTGDDNSCYFEDCTCVREEVEGQPHNPLYNLELTIFLLKFKIFFRQMFSNQPSYDQVQTGKRISGFDGIIFH